MAEIKPHCRALSANISELVVSAEAFIDSWKGWDRSQKAAKSHFTKMEENYNALPDEIKGKLMLPMNNMRNTLEKFYEVTFAITNARELQKIALSEGLVQIAACIVEE